jgi:hypothetical protein
LVEQLGNVGSEIGRAARAHASGDVPRHDAAVTRGLELLDLTIGDERWVSRLKELVRARETIGDAMTGGTAYGTTWESLDRYFIRFATAARRDR